MSGSVGPLGGEGWPACGGGIAEANWHCLRPSSTIPLLSLRHLSLQR